MRIWWQSFVDAKQNPAYLERLSAYLNEVAGPAVSVEVKGTTPPDRDFGRLTEFRCSIQAVNNAIEAEQQGYDGFIMGHFQDPGLYEARSAVRIPVIGTGEATLHFAAQVGRRIGLVSIDPIFEVWHYEQAERYGLANRIAGVTGLGAIPEDFAAAFAGDQAAYARMLSAFMECARPLVEKGADVIVPAGVLPGLLLARERGLTVAHAPVVNCAAVALKSGELWIQMHKLDGIEASRGPSYALAPRRAVEDFRKLVASGLQE